MRRLHTLEATVPGLAHALAGASPSLAQISPPSLVPQNNNSATACFEPQKAIAVLLDQRDDNIFAYLTFARSLDAYLPGHGSLSSDQVQAVRTLSPCTDDEITKWLEQARKLGEIVEDVLGLQELTPTSKPLNKDSKPLLVHTLRKTAFLQTSLGLEET